VAKDVRNFRDPDMAKIVTQPVGAIETVFRLTGESGCACEFTNFIILYIKTITYNYIVN
jgi:hypothetical protein